MTFDRYGRTGIGGARRWRAGSAVAGRTIRVCGLMVRVGRFPSAGTRIRCLGGGDVPLLTGPLTSMPAMYVPYVGSVRMATGPQELSVQDSTLLSVGDSTFLRPNGGSSLRRGPGFGGVAAGRVPFGRHALADMGSPASSWVQARSACLWPPSGIHLRLARDVRRRTRGRTRSPHGSLIASRLTAGTTGLALTTPNHGLDVRAHARGHTGGKSPTQRPG